MSESKYIKLFLCTPLSQQPGSSVYRRGSGVRSRLVVCLRQKTQERNSKKWNTVLQQGTRSWASNKGEPGSLSLSHCARCLLSLSALIIFDIFLFVILYFLFMTLSSVDHPLYLTPSLFLSVFGPINSKLPYRRGVTAPSPPPTLTVKICQKFQRRKMSVDPFCSFQKLAPDTTLKRASINRQVLAQELIYAKNF